MNDKAHRLIFDRTRGMFVAVAESASSAGKTGRSASSIIGGSRLAFVSLLLTASALAAAQDLPSGGVIVRGAGAIDVAGNAMLIKQDTSRMVTDWSSFSIGAGASVRFVQPSSSSVALNRVIGSDPTAIFGNLSANGHVYLQNPNGVLFAPGAQVNVGSLVATTLNADLGQFMSGRLRLSSSGGPSATVVNEGLITVAPGGHVVLAAPVVANLGAIEAPGGTIGLAAGNAVSVDATGSGLLSIEVPVAAIEAQVTNSGQLLADGGTINLQAAALDAGLRTVMQVDGLVRARRIESRGGQIVLSGGTSGVVQVGGALDATSADSRGGDVTLLGQNIALLDGSRVDASGAAGGGSVQVGGSARGQGPLPNAQGLFMAPGASIAADATSLGAGGDVVLWSDQATRAYGSFSARGGPLGGDGGSVETSGGWLDARPASVLTTAAAGRPGVWLLDPNDILIDDFGPTTNVTSSPNFTTTDDSAVIFSGDIVSALNAGNNVTITTSTAGSNSESGDIAVYFANILVNLSSPVSLTLTAHRNIDVQNSLIESGAGSAPLSVNFFAGEAGAGGIQIINSTIAAGFIDLSATQSGGSIYLGGNSTPSFGGFVSPFAGAVGFDAVSGARSSGVQVINSTLSVGRDSGVIQLRGNSVSQAPPPFEDIHGVYIDSDSDLTGANIDIRGWVASNPDIPRFGVGIYGQVYASQVLDVQGEARSTAYFPNFGSGGSVIYGVDIDSGAIVELGDPVCSLATICTMRIDGISQAGVGVAGSLIHASGLVVDGASINVTGPATVLFSGASFGGDISAEWGILFEPNSRLDFSAAPVQLTFDTRSISPSPSATYGIGFRGEVILPTGGDTRIASEDYVEFAGAITGAPSTLWVTANSEIYARGNALSPPLHAIALTGGAEVTLDAPEVYIGSAVVGESFALSSDGQIFVDADILVFRNSATLTSTAGGDAVWFGGYSTPFIADFAYEGLAGSELATPGGRWLISAIDPTVNFDSGLLSYAFRQYNAAVLAPPSAGNGLLFQIAPVLTASISSSISKVYDATIAVPGTPGLALSGFVTGDNSGGVGAGYTSLSFVDKDVGIGKPVIVSGLSLPAVVDGSGLPVYGYGVTSGLVGDISIASLTLSGLTALSRVYDTTTIATLGGGASITPLGSDVVTLTVGVGSFADKNVGTAKTVTVSGFSLAGADAANYVLSPIGALSADITPFALAVPGLTGITKVYDTTLTTTFATPAITPLGTDDVLITGTGLVTYADKNVGAAKPVSLTGLSLAGTDAGNYLIAIPAGLTAGITPRPLLASGVLAIDRPSNGDTRIDLDTSSATILGVLTGDSVSLITSAAFGEMATPDPGLGRPVTLLGFALAGPDGGNYQMDPTPFAGGVTVDVVPGLSYLFDLLRYNEYLQGVSDAQEPFRRAMAEALAAGFGKENIRKRLSLGLVFETGLAAPAIEDIQPAKGPEKCSAGSASGGAPLSCP